MMISRGFTLIELVIVMVIMGIVSVFSIKFITHSVQIYRQGADREQLMSDVRFGLERLNREVRNAVPGSLRIENGAAETEPVSCVSFWPITTAGRYTAIVYHPLEDNTTVTLPFFVPEDGSTRDWKNNWIIINPLGLDASTQTCNTGYDCAILIENEPKVEMVNQLIFSFTSNPKFSYSPTQRVYFALEQVRYCIAQGELTRTIVAINENIPESIKPILMAKHISSGKFLGDANESPDLYSTLSVDLIVSKNNESIDFRHKIRLYNAP